MVCGSDALLDDTLPKLLVSKDGTILDDGDISKEKHIQRISGRIHDAQVAKHAR